MIDFELFPAPYGVRVSHLTNAARIYLEHHSGSAQEEGRVVYFHDADEGRAFADGFSDIVEESADQPPVVPKTWSAPEPRSMDEILHNRCVEVMQ